VFTLQKALREPVPEKQPSDKIETMGRKLRGLFAGFGKRETSAVTTIQENTR
jgi:hypothetical protein